MVDTNILAAMRQQQHDLNDEKINAHVNDYGICMKSDIPYIDDNNEDHYLDIYSPTEDVSTKLPVVVLIHGGGYSSGYKELDRRLGQYVAKNGFHVVNMNYTLMPEVDFKVELEEVFAVFQWIKKHQEDYGFDYEHISLMGDSSGGHYVMLAAALQNNKNLQAYFGIQPYEHDLKAYVSICPSTFASAINGTGEIFENIVKVLEDHFQDEEYVKYCDYKYFVDDSYPEIMIVTTPTDSILAKDHIAMHEYMDAKGIQHVFKSYEGQSNVLDHVFNVLFPEYEESICANNDIIHYLKEKNQ